MQHISGLENIIEDLRQISKARELEQTDTSALLYDRSTSSGPVLVAKLFSCAGILSRSKGPSDFDGGEATLAPGHQP